MWSAASYIVIFLLGLVAREAFLTHFDNAVLGYSGVISNLFSLISVAEMGVGTVISYGLYREIQKKNKDEIAILMMIYKWIYRIIGVAVLIAGIVCYFLLPLMIVGENTNWADVRWVYAIELANAVLIYFLSFRRLLFVAAQQEYRCVRIEAAVQVIAYLVRIALAYLTSLYILYLAISLFANIVANCIICVLCNRCYPYAKYHKITVSDIKKRGLFKDMGSYALQKFSIAVYGGIDNILAMRFLGPLAVVMMTNYTTIEVGISSFFNKLLAGFQPSIGDFVYDSDGGKKASVFNGLNLLSFMIATFVAIGYGVLFQPFMSLWLGDKYLLPFAYVAWFSLNQYIGWNHRMLGYFRSAVGKFNQDQLYMVASAVSNVALSIVLIKLWGVAGLLAATCVGHLFQWAGRSHVVFKNFFDRRAAVIYWVKQAALFLLAASEMLLCIWICRFFPAGIGGIVLRAAVCLVLPNLINLLIFWNLADFSYVRSTLVNTAKKLRSVFTHK